MSGTGVHEVSGSLARFEGRTHCRSIWLIGFVILVPRVVFVAWHDLPPSEFVAMFFLT